MNHKRRLVIRAGMTAGLLALTSAGGLMVPRRAYAAWPTPAFDARSVEAALKALVGDSTFTASTDISLIVPELAENGASVPVSVTTTMEGVESISIFATKNFNPLIATFELGEGAVPYAETRIKMAETADVVAVVKAKGKLYSASKPVKVIVGGCAG